MNNEEKILVLLEKQSVVLEQQSKILEQHSMVLEQHSVLLGTFTQEQQKTNQRLDKLEEGQLRLESNINRLDEGQSRLESNINRLDEGQSRLESNINRLESKLNKLEPELADTKHHVILMENENKQLFGGLYDGHNVLLGYARENQSDIEKIKVELEIDDLRIKALDSLGRKPAI